MNLLPLIGALLISAAPVQALETWEDIDKYRDENIRCNYLLETEYQGVQYAVFYHPFPLKEYRGAYWTEDQYKWKDVPAVVEAEWIEEVEIDGVIADNGDVIFSRYPTERRTSDDGSVWIHGSDSNITDKKIIKTTNGSRRWWW